MTERIFPDLAGTRLGKLEMGNSALVFNEDVIEAQVSDPDTGPTGEYLNIGGKRLFFAGDPDPAPALQEGAPLVAKGVFGNRGYVGYANSIYDILPSHLVASIVGGRLSVSDTESVADNAVASALYYVPHLHNQIALYNEGESRWELVTFSAVTLDTGGVGTSDNWDVFGYNDAGNLALEKVVWAGNNTRDVDLALIDGVPIKTGEPTKRYLGTFRGTDSDNAGDWDEQRFVWNFNNRVRRKLFKATSDNSWLLPDSATAWRGWNSSDATAVEIVTGLLTDVVEMRAGINIGGDFQSGGVIGIAEGTSDHTDADIYQSAYLQGGYSSIYAQMVKMLDYIGYRKLIAVERYQGDAFQTATMYGTDGSTRQAGIVGSCWA